MATQLRLASESMAGRRPYQEDSVLALTLEDGRTLVAVADGMGGHAAGDVASRLAIETLVEAVEKGSDLAEAFTLANRRVHEKSREPGKQGMGTTMVAALIDGDSYTVANVGDSRCYLISDEGIRQISEDHSFVAEAVKRGQSEEEAMASRFKDALTRSIGTDAEVKVDTYGPFPVEENSALFLCSDGLYKVIATERIRTLYLQSGGPRGAAQSLVTHAYEDGSDDNISVVVAEWGEVRRERGGGTMPIEFEPPQQQTDDTEEQVGPAAGEPATADAPSAAAAEAPEEAGAGSGGGLPVGLIVAVVVVVAAVAAYLAFR